MPTCREINSDFIGKLIYDSKMKENKENKKNKGNVENDKNVEKFIKNVVMSTYIPLEMDNIDKAAVLKNQNNKLILYDDMNDSFGFFDLDTECMQEFRNSKLKNVEDMLCIVHQVIIALK